MLKARSEYKMTCPKISDLDGYKMFYYEIFVRIYIDFIQNLRGLEYSISHFERLDKLKIYEIFVLLQRIPFEKDQRGLWVITSCSIRLQCHKISVWLPEGPKIKQY